MFVIEVTKISHKSQVEVTGTFNANSVLCFVIINFQCLNILHGVRVP